MKTKQVIVEILVCLLMLLLVYASLSKLFDMHEYRKQMNNQAFPAVFKPYVLWLVPVAELVLTALLIFTRTRMLGLYGTLLLLFLFTGYIVLVKMNFYHRVPCSCGGVLSYLNWTQHLVFNIGFILLTIIAIFLERKFFHHPQKIKQ